MFTKVREENRVYLRIVDQVLEAVFREDLRGGDKLPSEQALAEIFGVGRGTVREAIRVLEQRGLLDVRQGSNGGAFIKPVDLGQISTQMQSVLRIANITVNQLAEARVALEEMIVRKLLPSKIQEKYFVELDASTEAVREMLQQDDQSRRLQRNVAFHEILSAATENPLIILMHKIIMNMSYYYFDIVKASPQMAKRSLEDHERIVKLLRQFNFDEAAELCSRHIWEQTSRIAEKSKYQSLLKAHNVSLRNNEVKKELNIVKAEKGV